MVTSSPWWGQSVIYQVYLRSFADGDGDGVGDLAGLRRRLHHLVDLGVDGLWLNPCYPSPQADHGYDIADYRDIDPAYGTLAEFDELLAEVHRHGLKLLLDIVPNHCSVEHAWFRAALRAGPGSRERGRFVFRPGRGPDASLPPNNWQSVFGGPAWTQVADGEWYLHLFSPEQPDFNWDDPEVLAEFDDVLRFWLNRGVDGFRVDVAHGLIKATGLPDWTGSHSYNPHMWNQAGVNAIHQRWRRVLAEYDRDLALVGEVWPPSSSELTRYAGPDRLGQVFYFDLLAQPWSAAAFRAAIERGLRAGGVAHRIAWTLGNHDVHRQVTRLGQPRSPEPVPTPDITLARLGLTPDVGLGQLRARAALLLLLSLPGAVYLYQGEELGLPEVLDLPDEHRQDPIWFRTGGAEKGRDGCRVPLPWTGDGPGLGFTDGGRPWLPQPAWFARYAVSRQREDPASTLSLYRTALPLRAKLFANTALRWGRADRGDVLAVVRDNGVTCMVNFGDDPYPIPAELGEIVLASHSDGPTERDRRLPGNAAAWLRTDSLQSVDMPSTLS